MPTPEWLYQQNAKRRRQREEEARLQMIQLLLLNDDSVTVTGIGGIVDSIITIPINIDPPVVTGTNFYVGDVLTTTNGTWSGSPTSFTYQWYNVSLGDDIVGATNNTYTLLITDADMEINCKVFGTNAAGSGLGNSNVIATEFLFAPTNIDLPVIDDGITYYEGNTIEFTGNVWYSNPPNPTLTYQWLRSGNPIPGGYATEPYYDAISADVEHMISVKCIATNSQGTDFVISNEVYIEP